MKYMLLIYGPDQQSTPDPVGMMPEYAAFTEAIVKSGELASGDRLEGTDMATTVRVRDGQRTTTDGPFAETKEVLGGYYVVDCKDLDRALELAAQIPGAKTGCVEVRPIYNFG